MSYRGSRARAILIVFPCQRCVSKSSTAGKPRSVRQIYGKEKPARFRGRAGMRRVRNLSLLGQGGAGRRKLLLWRRRWCGLMSWCDKADGNGEQKVHRSGSRCYRASLGEIHGRPLPRDSRRRCSRRIAASMSRVADISPASSLRPKQSVVATCSPSDSGPTLPLCPSGMASSPFLIMSSRRCCGLMSWHDKACGNGEHEAIFCRGFRR
jgi:hypothetical protein